MKVVDTAVALTVLGVLAPAAAFAPSAITAGTIIRRGRALSQQQASSQQTCNAPKKSSSPAAWGFNAIGVLRPQSASSALFGTGPSYSEVKSEMDGNDSEEGEDDGDDEKGEGGNKEQSKKSKKKQKKSGGDKEKVKLEAEVTFYEGGPDPSEMAAPAVSILTVIGLVPFTAAVARQVWVKYTLTSRRIKIVSGWGGKDTTEVVYPDIVDMKYVWRFFGRCGDLVLTLRDGSKLEIRSLPEFERNYGYIYDRTSASCQADSQKITPN